MEPRALAKSADLKTKRKEEAQYDLWILMSRVYHMIAKIRNMEMGKYGILPIQSYMLYMIRAMGNATTPAQLSRFVYQQRNSVSDILKRMEKQGLVTKEKRSDVNGRILVKMTAKGERALELSQNRFHLNNIMSALDEEKRRELESLLVLLRDRAIKELTDYGKTALPPSQLSKYYQEKGLEYAF
jgi:DNA-binding MarR family transcriptional regulator